jgi:carbamoyl-phosphate synthase small subunit
VNSQTNREAVLALADGTIFKGTAIGADGQSIGEVVFNTALTGYQEILTDPSYANQIVTLTYPHIGNVGVNTEDQESDQIWAAGLVIRDLPLLVSNFRSELSLDQYLADRGIVGIADIDTRKLTRILRETGSQSGCIVVGDVDEQKAVDAAKQFPGLKGMDLAKQVTTKEAYQWQQTSWQLGEGFKSASEAKFKVVAYDFGVKQNILRMLVDRGCDLTVVPAQTPASDVLAMNPDGVAGRNNSTRDDVVTVHQRTSNGFTDAIDVHRRSSDEGDDEADSCSKQRRNHQNAEPTDIQTVVSRGNPVTKVVPG